MAGLSLNNNYRQFEKFVRVSMLGLFGVASAFLAASVLAPVSNSSAEQQVTASIDDGTPSVSVSGAGTVALNVGSSNLGNVVSATDTLRINANAPEGYRLYVSMTGNSNRLYKDGNTSNPYLAPNQSGGTDVPVASPTTLANNSWGFTIDPTAHANNRYSAVPTSATLLSSATVSGNYTQNVYYAVRATSDIMSGNYTGSILYTVTSDAVADVTGIDNIAPTSGSLAGGESVVITVSLLSVPGSVSELGTITAAIGGNTCTITNTAITNGKLVITCTTPAGASEGAKNVTVSTQHYGKDYTLANGYTYEEPEAEPTFNSISPNNLTINNSTTKVALNLTVPDNITSVSDLGTISATIGGSTCSSPNSTLSGTALTVVCTAPSSSSAKTSNVAITIGRYSKTYTLSSAFSYKSKAFSSLSTMQQLTSTICNNAGVGETASLRDSRGYGNGGGSSTKYGVIKALDGNCWMTDNLNLYNKTISSSDSDTTSSFTIPASSNWSNNENAAAKVHVATNSGFAGQNYYNWCAATAQTSCSGWDSVPTTSICPKNWDLPTYASATSTTNGDYGKLFTAYKTANGGTLTGTDLTTTDTSGVAYPLGFRLYYGGWSFSNASESFQDFGGAFWSATPNWTTSANYMEYYSNMVNLNMENKGRGFTVRCVVSSS